MSCDALGCFQELQHVVLCAGTVLGGNTWLPLVRALEALPELRRLGLGAIEFHSDRAAVPLVMLRALGTLRLTHLFVEMTGTEPFEAPLLASLAGTLLEYRTPEARPVELLAGQRAVHIHDVGPLRNYSWV